jgi:lipopolysaccharide biosynthesis protein
MSSQARSFLRKLLSTPVLWRLREWREVRHLRQSGTFDGSAYLARYPDVALGKLDPITHWVRHGRHEGRSYLNEFVADGRLPAPQPIPASETPAAQRSVKLIAFYLPQFHPIPENDAWWGKGFTEWRSVVHARPLFEGHRQPRLPTDLGFYDLRVPETRQAQADLAARNGIHAFCYYYYWFDGQRILERPLNDVLSLGQPDFPFCICWANENWTRRWDGLDSEILLGQTYRAGFAQRFIRDVMPLLSDPRYVRHQGKPVLIVYRVRAIPDVERVLDVWRDECRAAGLGEIHIAGVRFWDVSDVRALGFDAAVDFPPHHLSIRKMNAELRGLVPGFSGLVYDYAHVVAANLASKSHGYDEPAHRGVMLAWDNTPRRGSAAHIAHGATPEIYGQWLRGVIDQEMRFNPTPESLVFINAWNEWAEGANLEPDSQFGSGFLDATQSIVAGLAKRADTGSSSTGRPLTSDQALVAPSRVSA